MVLEALEEELSIGQSGSLTSSLTAVQEFKRSWPVVLAAMVGMCCGVGGQGYWFGTLVEPLSRAHGWSMSQISVWSACGGVASLVLTPVAGWISDHHGVRVVVLVGLPLLAFANLSAAMVGGNIDLFYVAATAVGAFGAIEIAYFRGVVGSFSAGRGTALGLLFAGTATSSLIGPPLMVFSIDRWGVSGAFVVMAAANLVAIPIMIFGLPHRRPPMGHGMALEHGASVSVAVRLPAFWSFSVATLLHSMCAGALIFIAFPYMASGGISRSAAAVYVGLFGGVSLVGKLTMGVVVDRLPPGLVCMAIIGAEGVGVAVLGFNPNTAAWLLPLIGFAHGGSFPCKSYFLPRVFGVRNFGTIGGLMGVSTGLGFAFGPTFFSELRATGDSYEMPFLAMAAGLALAAIIFGLLGVDRSARRAWASG